MTKKLEDAFDAALDKIAKDYSEDENMTGDQVEERVKAAVERLERGIEEEEAKSGQAVDLTKRRK